MQKAEISCVLQELSGGSLGNPVFTETTCVFFKNTLPLHKACLAFRDSCVLEKINSLYCNSKFLVVSN